MEELETHDLFVARHVARLAESLGQHSGMVAAELMHLRTFLSCLTGQAASDTARALLKYLPPIMTKLHPDSQTPAVWGALGALQADCHLACVSHETAASSAEGAQAAGGERGHGKGTSKTRLASVQAMQRVRAEVGVGVPLPLAPYGKCAADAVLDLASRAARMPHCDLSSATFKAHLQRSPFLAAVPAASWGEGAAAAALHAVWLGVGSPLLGEDVPPRCRALACLGPLVALGPHASHVLRSVVPITLSGQEIAPHVGASPLHFLKHSQRPARLADLLFRLKAGDVFAPAPQRGPVRAPDRRRRAFRRQARLALPASPANAAQLQAGGPSSAEGTGSDSDSSALVIVSQDTKHEEDGGLEATMCTLQAALRRNRRHDLGAESPQRYQPSLVLAEAWQYQALVLQAKMEGEPVEDSFVAQLLSFIESWDGAFQDVAWHQAVRGLADAMDMLRGWSEPTLARIAHRPKRQRREEAPSLASRPATASSAAAPSAAALPPSKFARGGAKAGSVPRTPSPSVDEDLTGHILRVGNSSAVRASGGDRPKVLGRFKASPSRAAHQASQQGAESDSSFEFWFEDAA